MVGVFDRVFETGPVLRAETHTTRRHLNEYTSLDFEMGYIHSFLDICAMETGFLQYTMNQLEKEYSKELKLLNITLPDVEKIPYVRFDEAKRLVSEKYNRKIRNPFDLEPEEEELIGKYFRENRTPVKYEEISPIIINTLISTEDERFYKHFGVDIQGVFAAVKDMTHGKARGASTITQQLVKNMFKVRSQYSTGLLGYIPGVKLLIMKSKEWITAIKIEMFYTKQEILTMYFNTVDFGSNAYGIKTACKTYFNTTPKDITYEQAATLIGLLKATTTYNPRVNPKNSLKRRNVVLDNLQAHKIITKSQ